MDFEKRYFNLYGLIKFYFYKLLRKNSTKFKTCVGQIYLDVLNDGISKSYAYWGIREQDKHFLIFENIKEDDYVIDCGSNIGGYAKYINNIIEKMEKLFV